MKKLSITKKILIAANCLFCLSMFGQQTNPSTGENTVNEPSFKSVLDKLLKDDKMLNIMFDTRVDYQATFKGSKTDQSSFRGNTVKVWFEGEIIPGFRYRVRHRLNTPQNALYRDNYSSATDQAYFEIDAGKNLTFRVGKQAVQFGTFEFDYNAADVYLYTMTYNDLDAYKTGVNLAYRVAGQTLNFEVVNSDAPQFATDKYKNKSLAGLFLWEGSLFNNVFRTRYGYGAFQHDASKYYNWITIGNQINLKKFTAELDWYMGDRDMDYGDVVQNEDLGLRHVRDNSVSVNFKYDLGKIKPLIKGVWNKRRDLINSSSYINGGVQAAVEYYPFTDPAIKDLRFHLMYAYNRTNFNGIYNGLDGINGNQIIAGMRWFLKIK